MEPEILLLEMRLKRTEQAISQMTDMVLKLTEVCQSMNADIGRLNNELFELKNIH
jgi:hypothetical protein